MRLVVQMMVEKELWGHKKEGNPSPNCLKPLADESRTQLSTSLPSQTQTRKEHLATSCADQVPVSHYQPVILK